MPIETPPSITPVPTPVPQRGDRATFSDRVDAFVQWLEDAPPEFEALADNVENNGTVAVASASAAAASAVAADASADAADISEAAAAASATAADASADAALVSENAAAASAASAAAIAGAFVGTSTSSLTIGTGNKSFTTQTGEQYTAGITMTAVSQANGANFMAGQVVSYNSGTGALVINVSVTGGSGTFADWNLSLAGVQGPQGIQGPAGTLSGTAVGAINWNGTVTIPSAATVGIGAAASNDLIISGTTTITAFDTIAAGATRKVKFSGALTLTHNASTLILPGVANIPTAANDTAQFTSLGGGAWICDWYKKANGQPVISQDTSAMVLLAALSPTAAANVDALSVFTAAYDNYLIIGQGLTNSAGAGTDRILARLAVAGTADSGANYFQGVTGLTSILITPNVLGSGKGANFDLTVKNANDTAHLKMLLVNAVAQTATTPNYSLSADSYAVYPAANAVSGVRFYWESGSNFGATGKFFIYGIKNS